MLTLGTLACGCTAEVVPVPTLVEEPKFPKDVDIRDFGADGRDTLDDTSSIEAAIASLPPQGGTVFIPAGTFYLTALHPNPLRAIDLSSRTGVILRGEGSDLSELKMREQSYSGAVSMILIERGSHVQIRGLTLNGNRDVVKYKDEQSHALTIVSSTDVRISDVAFIHGAGDGIRILGAPRAGDPWTERIVVEDSDFEDNARNGISIQRAVNDLVIRGNRFVRISDQSISSEPTGTGGPTAILVEDNLIEHSTTAYAVGMGGVNRHDLLQGVRFRRNRIENGAVLFAQAQGVEFEENVIIGDSRHSPLRFQDVDDIRVIGNQISGGDVDNEGAVQVVNDAEDLPSLIVLEGNDIRVSEGMTGVYIRDAKEGVQVRANRITGPSGRNGIMIENVVVTGIPRSGFSILNNTIRNYEFGVRMRTRSDTFADVEIGGNQIDHDRPTSTRAIGIVLSGFLDPDDVRVFSNLFGEGVDRIVCIIEINETC